MIIRELKQEDISAVEEILGMYWSGELKEHFIKRVLDYANQTPETIEQKFKYFVAEKEGEVVGVIALRQVPAFMKQITSTPNPAEFYIAAVKYKRRGIGTALMSSLIKTARDLGFTEAIFFSAESHKDAWSFHDQSGFKRVGPATAPNGESGYIWRIELK